MIDRAGLVQHPSAASKAWRKDLTVAGTVVAQLGAYWSGRQPTVIPLDGPEHSE